MPDTPQRQNKIDVEYFNASTPGAVLAKAAAWCNANDGSFELEAVNFVLNRHVTESEEVYELGLYYEPI